METKDILSENLQKDYYYGGVWSTWDKDLVLRIPSAIKTMKTKLSKSIEYYKFLQFKFFEQWNSLKSYANKNQIEIIGDIPIFVAYDSSDVWANQKLFALDDKGFPTDVAGVPPDYFSQTGQLWGNPIYNWDEHKKDGYDWWIKRIKSLLSTSDIIRIDHFRGFESFYAIPFGSKDATFGKWIKGPGKKLFDIIKKEIGTLPIIAEDLGIITPKVTKLRESLNLPGMKILQFAFDNSENNAYLPHNFEKAHMIWLPL
ncbi:4-alpha-glucanotransferase [bioreactor metagenome]|uniref:4-alpha-glucanotransferase n=1 Tax=bioreactor metagenome TaxID=1076179 RepID=A0A645GC84_9ZZZZ